MGDNDDEDFGVVEDDDLAADFLSEDLDCDFAALLLLLVDVSLLGVI